MIISSNKFLTAIACLAIFTLQSCGGSGGDTDGGKAADQNFQGTQFVPNSDNSGSISVQVVETDVAVSDTTGFFVNVRDSAGAPVPQIQVSCDSEDGVSILEPTTGAEITDSGGSISGRIGCAAPGSFLFGCRLPVGGNLRQFVTVKCSGAIPTGSDGFEGSAGGGLGTGGVDTGDGSGVGGTDTDGIRLVGISVDDDSTPSFDSTNLIDTTPGICIAADGTTTPEPFFDGFVQFQVVNNTNSNVVFTNFKYSIAGFQSSGAINFVGDNEVTADGGSKTFQSIAFSAQGSSGLGKYVIRGTQASNIVIPSSTNVRNVRFTLTGTTSRGQTVEVSSSVAISFINYNKCTS